MANDPQEWVRVTDLDTGHKRSIRRTELPHGNYRELKADALNPLTLDVLPEELNAVEPAKSVEPSGQKATTSKES